MSSPRSLVHPPDTRCFSTAAALIMIALAAASALGTGLAHAAPAGRAVQPVEVLVAPAMQERVADRVEALGTLRANETTELRSTVTEIVTAVLFDDNDRVSAGDVLVEMTSSEESAQLAEAISEVDEARAQYERIKPLTEQGVTPQSDLDLRQRDLDSARARLRAVQARMGDRIIVAPFDGVLGLRNLSRGALISPSDVITTINDDSIMKLDMSVPSVHLPALRPGLRVEARSRALGEHVFEGTIAAIDNAIDPVTRSIRVRALVPNPDGRLLPGLLMQVTLYSALRDAIVVPEESVVRRGQEAWVYVAEPAGGGADALVARQRAVTPGVRLPGRQEIIDGIDAGERVITHGVVKLRPNAPITVLGEDDGRPLDELLAPRGASTAGGAR